MPIYEYACQACGHRLEAMQKMNDAPLTECPACGKPQLQKLMSAAAGFSVKGGSGAAPSGGHGCGGGCACAFNK